MKHRNPAAVFFLPLITLGIYGIVWQVKTKNEMNKLGAEIPTAWLLIVPFVSIYWMWKYCEGIEKVTKGKLSTPLAFVILLLLGCLFLFSVGMAIIQSEFNKVADGEANTGPLPGAQPQPVAPVSAAGIGFDNPTVPPVTVSPAPMAGPAPAPQQPMQPAAPAPDPSLNPLPPQPMPPTAPAAQVFTPTPSPETPPAQPPTPPPAPPVV